MRFHTWAVILVFVLVSLVFGQACAQKWQVPELAQGRGQEWRSLQFDCLRLQWDSLNPSEICTLNLFFQVLFFLSIEAVRIVL